MNDAKRLPPWLRRPPATAEHVRELRAALRRSGLHTVCESARCPNIHECFARPTATFMIMGDVCTRGCRFCAVSKGEPEPLDQDEPQRLAGMAARLGLRHVVLTSVTRDDLPDGGAAHFRATCRALAERLPEASVEALVPDFCGSIAAIELVAQSPLSVFNHNLETVPRLYPSARPSADYRRSLDVLRQAKACRPGLATKSGLMVGLGEQPAEIAAVLDDLRDAGCDMLSVGQYMRPRLSCLPVARYWEPAEFDELTALALAKGFKRALCGPLVRSSYLAEPLDSPRQDE